MRSAMRGVRELGAGAIEHLLRPEPGRDVCGICFNLTRGFDRCYACSSGPHRLDVVSPISYSVAGEQLHRRLVAYKRTADPWVEQATRELAGILWLFLEQHERCVAAAAGVDGFELVTTVPSGERGRDEHHPLRRIVGELVEPTRARHRRVLRRTAVPVAPRRFDQARFEAVERFGSEPAILLIDDMWTSGASAQSAADALLQAGAGRVACVVIGRHLNPGWAGNDARLARLRGHFDFSRCPRCSLTSQISPAA